MDHRAETSTLANMRIRPAEAPHIADLIRIGDETHLSPWSAQCYLDEMKNPDAVLLRIVDENNLIAGFIVGRVVPGSEPGAGMDAEIYNMAVSENLQKQGLGQLLFNAFTDVCHGRQVANIWLEVRESNLKAIAFYEKNGFQRAQTRRHFYSDPREHALLMKLTLE